MDQKKTIYKNMSEIKVYSHFMKWHMCHLYLSNAYGLNTDRYTPQKNSQEWKLIGTSSEMTGM